MLFRSPHGTTNTIYAGLSNGGQAGNNPPMTDFAPARPLFEGDMLFTEIMYNPDAVLDENGEYLELYNPTSRQFTLENCVLEESSGSHTIGDLVVGPGQYVVMGRNADSGTNGGISGVYSYGADIQLGNSSGEMLALTCGGTLIDGVDFSAGWPGSGTPGTSLNLNALYFNSVDNDDATRWCDSDATFGDGDLGTPGADNNTCGVNVLINESFDTFPPAGWTVEDINNDGITWYGCDNTTNPNGPLNGANGSYACVDSDEAGSAVYVEEALISPSFDCSGSTTVTLQFWHYYNNISSDSAAVEVSTDGGATWTAVETYTADTANGEQASLDISAVAAGQSDVMVRFYYDDADVWAWYWFIDDVVVIAD